MASGSTQIDDCILAGINLVDQPGPPARDLPGRQSPQIASFEASGSPDSSGHEQAVHRGLEHPDSLEGDSLRVKIEALVDGHTQREGAAPVVGNELDFLRLEGC